MVSLTCTHRVVCNTWSECTAAAQGLERTPLSASRTVPHTRACSTQGFDKGTLVLGVGLTNLLTDRVLEVVRDTLLDLDTLRETVRDLDTVRVVVRDRDHRRDLRTELVIETDGVSD
jgi:hypothetical protein